MAMQIGKLPLRSGGPHAVQESRAQSSLGPPHTPASTSRGPTSRLTSTPTEARTTGPHTLRPSWKASRQSLRLEQEREALEESRSMKRTSQIAPHRTDQDYVMAGNAVMLKPRYQVDSQQLASVNQQQQLGKAGERRPFIKPRTPRAAELAAARKAAKSATSKSGRQSTPGSAGKGGGRLAEEEASSFLLTQADPASVQPPDNTPRPPDSDRTGGGGGDPSPPAATEEGEAPPATAAAAAAADQKEEEEAEENGQKVTSEDDPSQTDQVVRSNGQPSGQEPAQKELQKGEEAGRGGGGDGGEGDRGGEGAREEEAAGIAAEGVEAGGDDDDDDDEGGKGEGEKEGDVVKEGAGGGQSVPNEAVAIESEAGPAAADAGES